METNVTNLYKAKEVLGKIIALVDVSTSAILYLTVQNFNKKIMKKHHRQMIKRNDAKVTKSFFAQISAKSSAGKFFCKEINKFNF